MAQRARHEARWTADDAVVKGKVRRNRLWVVLLLFGLVGVLSTWAYTRLLNFQDLQVQLRVCQEPLGEDATGADVTAAGCVPTDVTDERVRLWHQSSPRDPVSAEGPTWLFEDVPIDTVANAVQVDLADPARSVVLFDHEEGGVRTALTPDAADTRWTGTVGTRGPTSYWLLVTPAQAG
ncbi:hypothetical protein [uncultured Ornithinimicrobium sp.]|uniref:hypothetical protein n=1 Tax=uncultured Ornithinimicrobium sp. TaxID=259307 RepID=UPI0025929763|nr:hypothetical protein [uncultured Ornithinimicrobium sp.]